MTHLNSHEFFPGIGDGIAKCPFDPEDNATAVWVGKCIKNLHCLTFSSKFIALKF